MDQSNKIFVYYKQNDDLRIELKRNCLKYQNSWMGLNK